MTSSQIRLCRENDACEATWHNTSLPPQANEAALHSLSEFPAQPSRLPEF